MKILTNKQYAAFIDLAENTNKIIEDEKDKLEKEFWIKYNSEYRNMQMRIDNIENSKKKYCEEMRKEKEELQEKIISLKNKINILIKKIK